jgi:hypothetical protein
MPLLISLMTHISKRGLIPTHKIQRAPLPEQLSIPSGGLQDYRSPNPRHEVYGGDLTYYNYWYGNQMPGTHIFTVDHAWYETGNRSAYKDISVQRSGAYFGQLLSVLDTARLQAAAKAQWAKLASNNG